ncbi:hypothetical protein [Roseovarius aestuarii]|uniref:Uncharacterized protein n=1 Tax=Roseovarius aestuarii TaxID=475083 RepID=A0A1X7BV43_9RHOB|nr:hypothetical protein [Roseovarius aestuarii]SMC13498.1 hypothetical protein ROA7745_03348 [Roseovarius aestuarii]
MPPLENIDRALMSIIITVLMLTVGISLWDKIYFALKFAAEDGVVEYGTAIALLISSIVLIRNALSIRGRAGTLAVALTFFYALLFFFAAGEEVSWGQRIFGWESGEYFQENNIQNETNLHNIVVGDKQLTKTLFGPILTVVLLLYLVVLPLLYQRLAWVQRIADTLAVPVPGLRHAATALIGSIIVAVIDAFDVDRAWEVYECVFALLTVSIFLLPTNRDKVT